MLYRKSPPHPTRLLLSIAAGMGVGATFTLASCGGGHTQLGSLTDPGDPNVAVPSGSSNGGGSGATSSGGTSGIGETGGSSSGSPGGGCLGDCLPPPPPGSTGSSSGSGGGAGPDASLLTGSVSLPEDGGADVRLGLVLHPEAGEDVLLGTIVHPEGGEDVFLGTVIHPDGGPFGVIIRPPDAGH
ncbi:MAG TPA: hypothetical protein VKU41_26945 [Polyangiaceae bacterium]|nr:hypothetical protein [Polyangiaceae bacterium]